MNQTIATWAPFTQFMCRSKTVIAKRTLPNWKCGHHLASRNSVSISAKKTTKNGGSDTTQGTQYVSPLTKKLLMALQYTPSLTSQYSLQVPTVLVSFGTSV
jgi:hypothetical protein